MKFFKQVSLLFLLTTAFAFVGCNDEDPDTVGPTIEITNIPDNKEFKFGENLSLHFKFSDQTGVFQYQYRIYAAEITEETWFLTENLITFEGFFTEKNEIKSVLLPAKSPSEIYLEGNYIIEVLAKDINNNISTYYKPIRIVYPAAE